MTSEQNIVNEFLRRMREAGPSFVEWHKLWEDVDASDLPATVIAQLKDAIGDCVVKLRAARPELMNAQPLVCPASCREQPQIDTD